jgi:hypothetical protein
MVESLPFLWLSNISLCSYTTLSLSILLMKNTKVDSIAWLL